MANVEVKTVDGSILEVHTAMPHPTVGDVCDALASQHGYRKNVRLLFGGQIMQPTRRAEEFPQASLIVVGSRAPQASPVAASSPGSTSPSGSAASPASRHPTHRSPSISPSRRQLPPDHITVTVLITDSNTKTAVHVHKDATVGDLLTHTVAKEPKLHGCRFLFHGHAMDNMGAELRHFGVGDGAVVHAVSRSMSPAMLKLSEARRQLDEMVALHNGGADLDKRKGLYEQSMRLLFSLDGLEVEGNGRQDRKDLVKRIQQFQDALGVAGER
uniref:BAG domain-containing protein n=1 Tax=Neobodo designis TaxID=312471 RepID=A0A7S1MQN3_NEODS|mmetsp:Transcript_45155/g.139309  ORF Transcript_45155/g.139309 Transcript_45155/m.139309 type:complete len:271 (+) Transcript_45155:59-871(+)